MQRLRDHLKVYARDTGADTIRGIADWFEQQGKQSSGAVAELELTRASQLLRDEALTWEAR